MSLKMNPTLAGATALVLASLLASPSLAQRIETASPAATAPSAIRIDNFGKINSTYYRGAQPEGRDYADLAALGVKTLINLTSDDAQAEEKAMADSAGLHYVQIPMTTHEPPTAAKLAAFMKIVTDPARLPVYVHCVGGRHRTGVMTALYRMTQEGWSAEQAFKEMKLFKFGADFLHPEFKKFVFSYSEELARNAPAPGSRPAGGSKP